MRTCDGGCSHCRIGLASTVNQYLVINDGGRYTFFSDANIACSEYGEPQNAWYSISFSVMIALQPSEAKNFRQVDVKCQSKCLHHIPRILWCHSLILHVAEDAMFKEPFNCRGI